MTQNGDLLTVRPVLAVAMVLMALAAALALVTADAAAASNTSEPAVLAEAASGEGGETEINPIDEFRANRFGPELKFGPVDMSITKPVIYLWLAALLAGVWAFFMRSRLSLKPNRKQTFTELFYEFGHDQIAKASLGHKTFATYMPFIASLFIFIWLLNIISFLPLPLGAHTFELFGLEIPTLGIYAATSNINVTLILTLTVIAVSCMEGVRHNGLVGWLKSFVPGGVSGAMVLFIWPLEALGRLLRIVSLSVRLFANMLAGHLLIGMMLAMIIILGTTASAGLAIGLLTGLVVFAAILASRGKPGGALFFLMLAAMIPFAWALNGWEIDGTFPVVSLGTVPISWAFYLFEVGLVASLQAYIFALLSGIYIGTEAEPAH